MDDKLNEQVEKSINRIVEQGIQEDNLDILGKLVDIHKDLANEEYWCKKGEYMDMRYRGYEEHGNYGNEYGRRGRDSRGRYSTGRGPMGRYRGEDMIDDMHKKFYDYSEGKEEMNMGNYGAKNDTMKSLDYMLQSVVDFIEMLKKDANSQEEIDLIREYSRQISEM